MDRSNAKPLLVSPSKAPRRFGESKRSARQPVVGKPVAEATEGSLEVRRWHGGEAKIEDFSHGKLRISEKW